MGERVSSQLNFPAPRPIENASHFLQEDAGPEIGAIVADRAQGLMFRRSLPENQGMLFDFGRVEPIGMWMQNTYVSLDMVFIRADGTTQLGQGVKPDEEILPKQSDLLVGRDTVYERALAWVRNGRTP